MNNKKINLDVKLQNIYYEDLEGELGLFYTDKKDRITINEAKEILTTNHIDFQSVFKVRKETMTIELTIDQLNNLIKK